MEFARFDPDPFRFPKPRISLLPTTPTVDWRKASAAITRQSPNFRHFSRGRYALGAAFRLAGVGAAGDLLAPAYHCVTMLDPALNLGATIHLYHLRADLSPDLADLESTLEKPGRPVKAVLATHFFGLIQDFGPLRTWCDKHGLVLIEDCSHALFTDAFQASRAGSFGHFVTSSPYKFFACEDGGLLYCRDETELLGTQTESASLTDEIRAIKRGFDKFRMATTQAPSTREIDEILHSRALTPPAYTDDIVTPVQAASKQFSHSKSQTSSLRSSRLIARLSSIDASANARRMNYLRWLDGVADQPNCRPLYSALPNDCIPYMFPLLIDFPAAHFYWLKQLGVPIWRWDEMAVSDCPVAGNYRHRLLHLPCHQSLSNEQMGWMITAVGQALSHSPPGAN